jgi:hypothetical protein
VRDGVELDQHYVQPVCTPTKRRPRRDVVGHRYFSKATTSLCPSHRSKSSVVWRHLPESYAIIQDSRRNHGLSIGLGGVARYLAKKWPASL